MACADCTPGSNERPRHRDSICIQNPFGPCVTFTSADPSAGERALRELAKKHLEQAERDVEAVHQLVAATEAAAAIAGRTLEPPADMPVKGDSQTSHVSSNNCGSDGQWYRLP
jgi:hypothetical protein